MMVGYDYLYLRIGECTIDDVRKLYEEGAKQVGSHVAQGISNGNFSSH